MDPDLNHALPQTPDQSLSSPHTETSATTVETSSAATTTDYTSPGTPQDQLARQTITNLDLASVTSRLRDIALRNPGHADSPLAPVPKGVPSQSASTPDFDDTINPNIIAEFAQPSTDGLLSAIMLQDIWSFGMFSADSSLFTYIFKLM